EINQKYQTKNWKPIETITKVFTRSQVMNFYKNTQVCLVTPLDDGMNLVSKEFIISASQSKNPGMLVLSQFAGSAIDLSSALTVNPYNHLEVAKAIKQGLEMPEKERKERVMGMAAILDERNIYDWAEKFISNAETAAKENRR
ncbi:MAG: trehalose-6-phosphate synthase, partial [Patescibacteria group bacterium]|nr:trehalose-6-phosphate synthase [Patescibacteria group bacterium]